jgi:mitochondrial FAD-linked sulfhydryl oxidase
MFYVLKVAAHYPEQPSDEQKRDVKGFFNILSRLYPCEFCAKDFQKE